MPGVGHQVNGASRWVGGGLLQFQPSELAKLALVLYGAYLLSAQPRRARTLGGLGPYLLVVGLPVLLIAKEPDHGRPLLLTLAVCRVLFVARVPPPTQAPAALT